MTAAVKKRGRHDLASIVDVAIRVFAERGYDGTTIDEIAVAAGVAKATLYHHVDGKADLLRLAIDRAMSLLQEMERREVLVGETALERLRLVSRTVIRLTVEKEPNLALIRHLPLTTTTAPWALKRYVKYEALTGRYVRDAIDEGVLRDDIDPLLLSRYLWFSTTGIADIHRLDPSASADALSEVALQLLLDGARRR